MFRWNEFNPGVRDVLDKHKKGKSTADEVDAAREEAWAEYTTWKSNSKEGSSEEARFSEYVDIDGFRHI